MTDEKLFAWLDGELDEPEASQIAAEVAGDAHLSARAAAHRALGERLRGAFDPVAQAPVPERMSRAIGGGRKLVDFTQWRKQPAPARAVPAVSQWMAMAATLVVGILIGELASPSNSPVELKRGSMVAASALDLALDSQLASAPPGEVRIGLTYRDRGGRICRTFSGAVGSGLACRNGGDWRVEGLFATPQDQASDYRMAAGADPRLAELVDSTIAGEAFDAEGERRARDSGWK